jgi:hypothetical protein
VPFSLNQVFITTETSLGAKCEVIVDWFLGLSFLSTVTEIFIACLQGTYTESSLILNCVVEVKFGIIMLKDDLHSWGDECDLVHMIELVIDEFEHNTI